MRIDRGLEPVVREAFAASVAGEPERFDRALEAIAERGDAFARDAVSLALAVDGAALLTVHEGERPDVEQLDYLAEGLAGDAAEWSDDVTREAALEFLTTLAEHRPTTLKAEDVTELAFGAGGWLLSAFLPEDGEWTDFLDRILARLESEPR